MTLLITSLSAFFVVQLIKVITVPKLTGEGVGQAIVKLILAGAAGFGAALLVLPGGHWKAAAAYGLAGAGLAVILHKGTRLLSNLGDESLARFLRLFR